MISYFNPKPDTNNKNIIVPKTLCIFPKIYLRVCAMSFKLNINQLNEKLEIEPSKIFRNLKRSSTYAYPRDVQDQVWSDWFTKKDKKNLVIKMNTGSGKTVVGLMILQSSLNELKGPALYVCPNNQLASQVIETANELNLSVTDDVKSFEFQNSKSIGVITIQKLVNGMSVFGINTQKISIGSLIIDDAHACLDIIEDQFTLEIPRDSDCGQELWELFSEDLKRQYETKYIELEAFDPHEFALIPYWDWQSRLEKTYSLLRDSKDESFLKFKWGLVKQYLKYCSCVCTHKSFEISPFQIPIDVINTLRNTDRIIFMTATMADDSILFSHFNVEDYSKDNVIQPKNCNDIGERLILIPKAIDPNVDEDSIRKFCKEKSESINVVVIVPSYEKAKLWANHSDLILDSENIDEGVDSLKNGHIGLVVLVNRYDGIDLPDEACRLLVIDGVPPITRYIDKMENDYLGASSSSRLIQKIEQGMGRGVRSNLDYCAVILMDSSLTDIIYNSNATENFSPATKAQYDLSANVTEQIKEQNSSYEDAIGMCLDREDNWVEISKSILNDITSLNKEPSSKAKTLRSIYNQSISGTNIEIAVPAFQDLINKTDSMKEKGYLKQILSTYLNVLNPTKSQEIQLSAKKSNNLLLRPLQGISYTKVQLKDTNQSKRCIEYLEKYMGNTNGLVFLYDSLVKNLEFNPKASAKLFEKALAEIVLLIGFSSEQPDATINKGPDVLLNIYPNVYLIIECKNQAENEKITKNYCGQLLNSTQWFVDTYKPIENEFSYTPIIIYPSKTFDYHASPMRSFRVMTDTELNKLKGNIYMFIQEIISSPEILTSFEKVNQSLKNFNLIHSDFVTEYTCSYVTSEKS